MLRFNPVRNVRTNTMDFRPPIPNPLVQGLFDILLPLICRTVLKGMRVRVDDASMARLKSIRGQRCLLLPNHPVGDWDPCVMFEVGRILKEHFFFVAAREVFDYSYGIRGWLFQRLGVYSLVRGSNDRKSLKTSMDILCQNKGRLVIFIEGEVSHQNETLLPLESGVIQLAFMAFSDLYKERHKDLNAVPSLYICPVGLRYVYDEDGLDEAIEASLTRLEAANNLKAAGLSRYERLKRLARVVLEGAAAQFGYPLDETLPPAANVAGLSDFVLGKFEHLINLSPEPGLSDLDRIRRIRNTLDKILGQTDIDTLTEYQKHLYHHQKAVLRHLHADLDRVVNFVAVYDGYLHPEMPSARYVEMLRRLEKEVFDEFRLAHPRTARVTVLEPIDLKAHFQAFLDDKKGVVARMAADIEQQLYAAIREEASAALGALPADEPAA